MRDSIRDRVKLNVLNDAFNLLSSDVQIDFKDVWVEDDLVDLIFRNAEVDLLSTAVQHTRNLVVCAERVGIFFPYALTERAAQ